MEMFGLKASQKPKYHMAVHTSLRQDCTILKKINSSNNFAAQIRKWNADWQECPPELLPVNLMFMSLPPSFGTCCHFPSSNSFLAEC